MDALSDHVVIQHRVYIGDPVQWWIEAAQDWDDLDPDIRHGPAPKAPVSKTPVSKAPVSKAGCKLRSAQRIPEKARAR